MNTLLAGYNIPYLVALGCCVLCTVLQIVGAGDHDAGDAHADVDVDAHADGFDLGDALGALGVGRVPLMFVLVALLGTFGAFGLLANALALAVFGALPGWGVLVVLVISVVVALLVTAQLSRVLERLAPRSSTAVSAEQLVGRVGTVISPNVSRSYGRVRVLDVHGGSHSVFAVTQTDAPITEGAEVALVSYDPTQRRFTVRAL